MITIHFLSTGEVALDCLFFFAVCGSIISVFMCANKSILNSAELSQESNRLFFYSCKALVEPVVSDDDVSCF